MLSSDGQQLFLPGKPRITKSSEGEAWTIGLYVYLFLHVFLTGLTIREGKLEQTVHGATASL